MMAALRRYFLSGLLVWIPIWVTLLVIKFIIDLMDNTLTLMPHRYQHIPGLGFLVTLLIILLTGIVGANLFGKKLVEAWDALVGRIPLVRTVYNSVKQVLETLFTPGGQSFRKVLLVQYPHKDSWTIAFQTGDSTAEVSKALNGEPMVSFFVPTTPNPTSGFLLMAARTDVIELDMSVDQALKFVISLGVVQPFNHFEINKKLTSIPNKL